MDLNFPNKLFLMAVGLVLLLVGVGMHAGYHATYGHEEKKSSSSSLTGCLDNRPHQFRLSNGVTEFYSNTFYSNTWPGDSVSKSHYRNIEETFDLHCTITHYDQRITEPEVKK